MKTLRLGILLFLSLLIAGEAWSKPRNPRRRKEHQRRSKKRKVRKPKTRKANVRKAHHLKSVEWRPEVWIALEGLVERLGRNAPGFARDTPPIAVIALNDTVLVNDLGLAAFRRKVDRAEFKFDDKFWRLIPIGFGRQPIRASYEQFRDLPVSIWGKQATYRQFQRLFFKSYRDICRRRSLKECRAYLGSLWYGFREDEVRSYARKVIDSELRIPIDGVLLQTGPQDPDPIIVRKGIRIVPQMAKLISLLLRNGFDVRLISSESVFVIGEIAAEVGLEPSKVIGLEVISSTSTRRITGDVLEPVPVGIGRAAAMFRRVAREPSLIVGGHHVDFEMLKFGRGLKLLIDHGDSAMLEFAAEYHWLVQPAFTRQ